MMKRDMDLCRKVLQHIEGRGAGVFTIDAEDLGDGYSDADQDDVDHHVKIMVGAGFIYATGTVVHGAPVVMELTWEGHEFVEQSMDPGLWEKAKQLAKEKTGGLAFGVLSPLLVALAKKALDLD
jgi:hypothetical protein